MIVNKYYKVIRVLKDGGDGPTPLYIENISGEDGVFITGSNSTSHPKRNLLYKVDNGEWFEYPDDGTTKIDVPNGSRIYLMGNNSVFSNSNYYTLKLTKKTSTSTDLKCNIGGYLTSLVQTADFDEVDTIPDFAFVHLFYYQKVVSAQSLITDNIKNAGVNSFQTVFQNCTSLQTLPEGMFGSVTSVSGYSFNECFQKCTSLQTLPTGMFGSITGSGSNTFHNCFDGCTSLQTLPEGMFGSVTSVSNSSFYGCFQNCTSLQTLPEGMFGSVTSVSNNSFERCFPGCTSLTTLPEGMFGSITSVRSFSFRSCFQNCTSLLVGPNFKNITGSTSHDAFDNCFDGCSNLQLIYAPSMSAWNESYFQDWVKGVYPSGKMFVKSGVVPPTGTSGVPEGWQLLNY